MPTTAIAFDRVSNYYSAFVNRNINRPDLLDVEFPQIRQIFTWFSSLKDPRFLQLVIDLSSYLETRSLYSVLLNYCRTGLQIAGMHNANPGRLLILTSEAYFSLGKWERAFSSIKDAITLTKNDDPPAYAQATLALGRLQINKGEYRSALQTLKTAEELLSALSDIEGVAAAKSEVAAYLLVRGEYQQSLQQYLEIDAMLRQQNERVNHATFMLGVVYRRLKQYSLALHYLKEAFEHSRMQNNRNGMAMALHHLAWVYYDQHKWAKAKQLGIQAKSIYCEIENPRGDSDADEQLGLIAFHEKDFKSAVFCLEQALSTRLRLGNQPGAASTMRRLARIYLRNRNIIAGFRYLLRSFLLYYRMKMLSRQRLLRIFKSPFTDTL